MNKPSDGDGPITQNLYTQTEVMEQPDPAPKLPTKDAGAQSSTSKLYTAQDAIDKHKDKMRKKVAAQEHAAQVKVLAQKAVKDGRPLAWQENMPAQFIPAIRRYLLMVAGATYSEYPTDKLNLEEEIEKDLNYLRELWNNAHAQCLENQDFKLFDSYLIGELEQAGFQSEIVVNEGYYVVSPVTKMIIHPNIFLVPGKRMNLAEQGDFRRFYDFEPGLTEFGEMRIARVAMMKSVEYNSKSWIGLTKGRIVRKVSKW